MAVIDGRFRGVAWVGLVALVAGCAGTPPQLPEITDGSSGDASTGTTTREATTEAGDTATAPPAACGNGIVEGDEECDDANDDDGDGCTAQCRLPACDDGVRNGDESDLDCGGDCPPCPTGGACVVQDDCGGADICQVGTQTCALPRTCLDILVSAPTLPSGTFDVFPDGSPTPLSVQCDMDHDGGGWTQVLDEDFADGADPAWDYSNTSNCGPYQGLLGGFALLTGTEVSRDVDFLGIPHTEARLQTDFVFIDSWDGEDAYGEIDGVAAFVEAYENVPAPSMCGNANFPDAEATLDGQVPHVTNFATIAIGATLDQAGTDESWGLDRVTVWVR